MPGHVQIESLVAELNRESESQVVSLWENFLSTLERPYVTGPTE